MEGSSLHMHVLNDQVLYSFFVVLSYHACHFPNIDIVRVAWHDIVLVIYDTPSFFNVQTREFMGYFSYASSLTYKYLIYRVMLSTHLFQFSAIGSNELKIKGHKLCGK